MMSGSAAVPASSKGARRLNMKVVTPRSMKSSRRWRTWSGVAYEDRFLGFFNGNTGAFGVDAESRGDSTGVFADEEVHVEG